MSAHIPFSQEYVDSDFHEPCTTPEASADTVSDDQVLNIGLEAFNVELIPLQRPAYFYVLVSSCVFFLFLLLVMG